MIKKLFFLIFSLFLWVFFWISATITITLLIIISIFIPKSKYNPPVKLACRIMMYSVFLFPKLKGVSQKEIPYPVIYVANHVSFFDLFISGSVLPGYPRGLELKKHFSKPVYGWFITRFGEIPIDPSNRGSIKISFNEAHKILKKKVRSILVMPEGRRTRSGKIEQFRSGAFYLSRLSGVPIVPVVYKGLYERVNANNIIIKPGRFDVILMEPVYPDKFDSDEKMAEHIKRKMVEKLEEK
jgi:1-acyl-sn-glycerol-3-phosphate acyltransferase